MARPTKLNDRVQARIIKALLTGCTLDAAAAYGGVDYRTFRNWMKRGKEQKSGKYFQFRQAIKKAELEAEALLVVEIRRDPAWQSNAWILERRHPDKWGRKDRHEHTGKDGEPLTVQKIIIGDQEIDF